MFKRLTIVYILLSFLVFTSSKMAIDIKGSFTPIKEFEFILDGDNPVKPKSKKVKAILIRANKVDATSFLVEGKIKHLPENAIDGNNSTAWVESAKDNGVGEKITIYTKKKPYALGILPGFAKSKNLWNKNNRVSGFNIRFLKKTDEGIIEYYNEIETISVKLSQEKGVIPFKKQYVDFSDIWRFNFEPGEYVGIEIEITDVDSKNAIFNDTCISEIELYGMSE